MDSSADDPYPPTLMDGLDDTHIFDTDITNGPLDSSAFFNSAFTTDPTAGFLEDDGVYGTTISPQFPIKEPPRQDVAGRGELGDGKSTSPDSLSQDSSSDSSRDRKRKSSSRSSHSPQHLQMTGKPQDRAWAGGSGQKGSDISIPQGQDFDPAYWDLAHRGNREHETDGDSAASSPSLLNAGNRHVMIPQDSPSNASASSILQPMQQQPVPNVDPAFPVAQPPAATFAQLYGSLASPVGLPDEYMNGAAVNDMHAAFQPFAYSGVGAVAAPRPLSGPPSAMNASYAAPWSRQPGPPWRSQRTQLMIQHAPTKSRVETQIPIKLYLWPLPDHVKKLHLQRHTISKPKLLSKPQSTKSPDTYELYASLICTSAMLDATKHKKALARAAAGPQSPPRDAGSPEDGSSEGDEESSLNGGDVQICQGCITRERKRAGRKKARKPEEDELWIKDEAKRIIVFNTHEHKEWAEVPDKTEIQASCDRSHANPDGKENVRVAPGTMMVELPMRIACYCRHHQEKTGFQVIMTIKDHQDQLVAQQISANIMITDDHKTHAPPVTVGHPNAYFEDSQQHLPNGSMIQREPLDQYGLARNAHSATDLHGLQNGFHPTFMTQNMNAFAMPQQQPSQPPSASGTPHNLSRQASPSALMGPNVKRRKASGGPMKVPENLTMTRLQTGASNLPNVPPATMGSAMSSNSAATSPFHAGFPPPGLPSRPMARHRPQRSAQISTGPSTPSTIEQGVFNFSNRSQSLENFAAYQPQFSAPSSALPSRAPSPTAFQHQMQAMSNADLQGHQLHLANPSSGAVSPIGLPKVDKVNPGTGPISGGVEVACFGSGFHPGTVVMFGEAVATPTQIWGTTGITCRLPPAARAGRVIVTVQSPAQHNGLRSMQFPPQPMSTRPVTFTYEDDNSSQVMKDAMTMLLNKQTGGVGNVEDFARRILSQNTAGSTQWGGGNQQSSGQYRQASMQGPVRDRFDVEAAVLKVLDLIDLDDSPFPVQLDLRAQNGQTLLHRAASLGYQQLAAALLARGANVDARDLNGMSPLHMAALYGHTHIVRRLRMARGDPSLRSLAGFVPADMATSEATRREAMVQAFARPKTAPIGHKGRSLPGSSASLVSFAPPPPRRMPDRGYSASEEFESDDDDTLSMASTPAPGAASPARPKSRSRRNSHTAETDLQSSQLQANFVFAAMVAAWRDHLAPQIQNFQPHVPWTLPHLPALPPMPNLPDYQAHQLYRTLSSFVPPFPGLAGQSSPDAKDAVSRALMEDSAAPPAYEDIYPAASQSELDTKVASAAQAAAEATEDQKCILKYDGQRSASATRVAAKQLVHADATVLGAEHAHGDETKVTPAPTIKRLRSDSRLFFIWIPILVFVVLAMSKDPVMELWRFAQRTFAPAHDATGAPAVEVAP